MLKALVIVLNATLIASGMLLTHSTAVRAELPASRDYRLSFDEKSGLLELRLRGYPIIKSGYLFWSGPWQWENLRLQTTSVDPRAYQVNGKTKNGDLVLNSSGTMTPEGLEWSINLGASAGNKIFGGVVFNISDPRGGNRIVFRDPVVDADGVSWSLQLGETNRSLDFRIEPKPARVFFERGNNRELRVFLGEEGAAIQSGRYKLKVLANGAADVAPNARTRLSSPDNLWYEDIVASNHFPVDLSYLNRLQRPAGKHGFLTRREGKLEFSDGTLARFWGTNLTAFSLTRTGRADAQAQARRLSRLGFNLVRLHHLDSSWVRPNLIASEGSRGVVLNDEVLKSVDWWIKVLADEGIYVWLDLEVGRVFAAEGIPESDEMIKNERGPVAKGFAYLSPAIQERMRDFNAKLLNHVNAYTGLAYKDDPRIAFMLVTNENDLTHHFGNLFVPSNKREKLSSRYMQLSDQFADQNDLNKKETWRSWEFGPSKLFLNDLEQQFGSSMVEHLRQVGAKVPIAITSAFGAIFTVAGLPSLTVGDIVAVNAYAEPGTLEVDPATGPNIASLMSYVAVADRPIAITEWNSGTYPDYERAALPSYVASVAALQDWDVVLVYAYSVGSLSARIPAAIWEVGRDPAMLSSLAAAALLFRERHVKPGETIRYLKPKEDEFIDHPLSASTSRAIRTLTETSRWRLDLPDIPALPWFKPTGPAEKGVEVTDMQANFAGDGPRVCAETGDFCRDWRKGIFTVDTGETQSASGWIGGETISLANVSMAMKTAFASVSVQSLDQQPIAESAKILVSLAAQTDLSGGKPKKTLSEPVTGHLAIEARPGLHAFALFDDGLAREIPSVYADGRYNLDLDEKLKTLWVILKPRG